MFVGERIVNVGGTECPCGGTHVKNTGWIGGMSITKIKKVWEFHDLHRHMHAHSYGHTLLAQTHTQMYTRTHTRTHARTHARTYVRMHAHVHTHRYAHGRQTHTLIDAHTDR